MASTQTPSIANATRPTNNDGAHNVAQPPLPDDTPEIRQESRWRTPNGKHLAYIIVLSILVFLVWVAGSDAVDDLIALLGDPSLDREYRAWYARFKTQFRIQFKTQFLEPLQRRVVTDEADLDFPAMPGSWFEEESPQPDLSQLSHISTTD